MNLSNGEQIDLYIILIQVQHITILLEITSMYLLCIFFGLYCISLYDFKGSHKKIKIVCF